VNTEVILTENKPNGLKFRGIVNPFMLKSIEDNQYSGGFKRYEIDIYDEVDTDPSKEDIEKANEFFDKVGGRYSKGGKLSSKAKYIPKRDIAEIEIEKNGKSKSIDGANLLDGVYVKKGVKFADGGEVDKKGMIYALAEHISSGEIANRTDILDYDTISKIRTKAIQYYFENGDKPYSFNEMDRILKEIASSDEISRMKHFQTRKMLRSDENTYPKGTEFADGGLMTFSPSVNQSTIEELQGKYGGITIKKMRNLLEQMFPYSFGFDLFEITDPKQQRTLIPIESKGIQDDSIKIYFDNHHSMTFRVFQGGENTYFYFGLTSDEKEYIGTFGFKDEGDVESEYVTSFIAFLCKMYGYPFQVNHSVYAQGGTIKKSLAEFKNKVGASKYREATRGVDIKADLQIPALKKGRRVVTKKGKTSNQYGTFKNQVGSVYYENRPNHYDVNQPSEKRKIKLADGGQVMFVKNFTLKDGIQISEGKSTDGRTFYSAQVISYPLQKIIPMNENKDIVVNRAKEIYKSMLEFKKTDDFRIYYGKGAKYAQGGTFADGGKVGRFKVKVNQYIPYKSNLAVNYYYVVDESNNTINKNTGKIYRGKQMDNYKFSSREDAQKYVDKLNRKYAQGGTFADGGALEGAKIYVADLAEYNDGRLVGKWLDLSDYSDASELMGAIQEMLDEQTAKDKSGEVHEEWAVHDFEGFPRSFYSEYMGEKDFEKLYEIADVANDRGIPIDVLMEAVADFGADEDVERVAEAYYSSVRPSFGGEFKSFAMDMVDELGIEGINNVEYYFDYDSFGSDARADYTDEELEEYGYDELDDTELGERLVDDMGGIDQLGKETIEGYFDYDKFGDALEHDFISVKGDDGDYYFFNRNW
jgi:antirestriction protein